jgi:hypothetical protein
LNIPTPVPHPGHEPEPDSSGSEAKLISVTAYLQTAATVIPVLLVAGLLNPRFLRENSKMDGTARFTKIYVAIALASIFICVLGVLLSELDPEIMDENLWVRMILTSVGSIGIGASFAPVYVVAKYALDLEPHPDRLKAKRDHLERALRLTEAQIAERGDDSTDSPGGRREY